jgi:hypothetical protein
MKKPAVSPRVIGNPVACPATDDGEVAATVRRLDCRGYDGCLDLADRLDWESFTCHACDQYQAESARQRQVNLTGALQLGLEVIAPLVGAVFPFDDEAEGAAGERVAAFGEARGQIDTFDDEEAASGDELIALYRRARP